MCPFNDHDGAHSSRQTAENMFHSRSNLIVGWCPQRLRTKYLLDSTAFQQGSGESRVDIGREGRNDELATSPMNKATLIKGSECFGTWLIEVSGFRSKH